MVGQSREVGWGWVGGESAETRTARRMWWPDVSTARAKGKSKKTSKSRRAVEQTSKRTELECREGAGVKAKPRSEGNGGTERSEQTVVDLVVSRSIFEFQRVAGSGGSQRGLPRRPSRPGRKRRFRHVAPHTMSPRTRLIYMQSPPSRLARARRFSSYELIF